MDELVREIHADIKLMRGQLVELIKQGAVHNQILLEHEKRSTALETRLAPIEETHHFMTKFSGVVGVISVVLGLCISFLSLLPKK